MMFFPGGKKAHNPISNPTVIRVCVCVSGLYPWAHVLRGQSQNLYPVFHLTLS